jgi:hypothetical protein
LTSSSGARYARVAVDPMPVFIKRNDQEEGPYPDDDVRQRLATGELSADTPARLSWMPGWKTLATLLPARPRAASPPGSPATRPAEAPSPAAGLAALAALAVEFLTPLESRLGRTARANGTFFSYRVVTTAIQRLRLDLLSGATLSESGERFVAQAAAYLAMLAVTGWKRRGLTVSADVRFVPGAPDNRIVITAERERNGQRDVYRQDVLKDMHALLLRPPEWFPYLHGQAYALDSLTLPSPEYLYLYGTVLLQSPHAEGNWPRGERVGGLPEDFDRSKSVLVDDLHADCALPIDHEGLKTLSWWIVFPPYGWQMNDGQDYNMMTLFSQISHKAVVPHAEGIDYLRRLLECQAVEIRNLAARCLMVYRVPPRDSVDAGKYGQALDARDHGAAAAAMAKYQHQLEGVELTDEWHAAAQAERRAWLVAQPPMLSHRTAADGDPEYEAAGKISPERIDEQIAAAERLMRRYPDDWVLKVVHAATVMRGPDSARGEARLRELIADPADCFEGHSRLGTLLKHQGRRDEALAVYEDALRRWPWCHHAVDACMWIVTDPMVRASA